MNLIEHIKEIEKKYQEGQEIFHRQSVRFLLERISQLEQSTKQVQRIRDTYPRPEPIKDPIIIGGPIDKKRKRV